MQNAFIRTLGTLTIIGAVSLMGCEDDPTDPIGEPATVEVTPDTANLTEIGATEQLSAAVRDGAGDLIEDAVVTWSSADETVAVVSADGAVTSVGVGETTVTATSGEASGTATVLVTDLSNPHEVVLDPDDHVIGIGDQYQLGATVLDGHGSYMVDVQLEWSVADEAVVTVDQYGMVTAVGEGTTTITAIIGEVSGTATVTVN